MTEDNVEVKPVEKRLCSEIQLFDICELDSCNFKQDRFCSNEDLLKKFEAIREDDDRQTVIYDEHEGDEDDFDSEEDYEDSEDYEE